jgi:hypothetical protein
MTIFDVPLDLGEGNWGSCAIEMVNWIHCVSGLGHDDILKRDRGSIMHLHESGANADGTWKNRQNGDVIPHTLSATFLEGFEIRRNSIHESAFRNRIEVKNLGAGVRVGNDVALSQDHKVCLNLGF